MPEESDETPAPAPSLLVDFRLSPEASAARHELRTALEAAIDALPTTLRAAFLLRDVEGLSTADAAEALGVSEANLKVRLHRARLHAARAALRVRGGARRQREGVVNCEDVVQRLSDYIDGLLPSERRREVEEHIASCQQLPPRARHHAVHDPALPRFAEHRARRRAARLLLKRLEQACTGCGPKKDGAGA